MPLSTGVWETLFGYLDVMATVDDSATIPTRDAVCAQLARMRPTLAAQGVSSLALFGSVARGDAREDSDIDLAIETRGKFSLLDLAGVKMFVEERMGRDVDLVFIEGLSPRRRKSALRDLIPIF